MHCVSRHNVIEHLINITSYALGSQTIHVICFIAKFTLLWWSGTEPAISLRYVYIALICDCLSPPIEYGLFEGRALCFVYYHVLAAQIRRFQY